MSEKEKNPNTSASQKAAKKQKKGKRPQEAAATAYAESDSGDDDADGDHHQTANPTSKAEAEKVLAEKFLQKPRGEPQIDNTETCVVNMDDSDVGSRPEKIIPVKGGYKQSSNIKHGCCDSCHEEITDLKESIASITEELQIIKRRLRKLRRTQPAAEMKDSESTEVENDCRTLVANSTSLFNTVSILLRRLFTAEEILAHSVSGEGSMSQTWTKRPVDKERSTLPRRRTGFNAGSLIPGSVSTMVSLPESDEDQNVTTLASPSFQSMLDSDASSEYETDLEEDFPVTKKAFDPSGRNVYHKLCKEEDLVPVSFLSDRFSCKEVVMRHHGLGSHGTYPIAARALIKNTFTEKLDLTDNYIEAGGAVALARMLLDNCFITEINLSQNFLRSEGGMAFASMLLKNQSLTKLVLKSNHLTDKDARAFADALKENRTLTHLDLSHNDIGEMGGIYLGAGLGMNYGLKHLDVSWNCIRFKGAVGMAQGLKTNDCLTHLNISWNGLSLLGCVALGRFLKKNEALESLDVSNNRIGLLATQKLALGIASHPNLKVLKIGKNPIGDGGVETLLNVVKAHRTIKFLSLEDITVSPKIFDEIKEIEKEKGVTVVTGGIGGYKRPKEMPPGMRILLSFIQDNRLRLVDWFNQFDKDHSGGISREEFKTGLKETGLVMTQRQLDRLMDFIDINDDGEIEFSELIRGREITIQEIRQEKKIEERQRKFDEQRMRLPKLEGYDYDLM